MRFKQGLLLALIGELMSLVLDAFPGSWDTAGMTLCQIKLFRETDSRPITSIVRQRQLRYMGMWRDTRRIKRINNVINNVITK